MVERKSRGSGENLQERLRALRPHGRLPGETQKAAAKKFGTSERTIRRYEHELKKRRHPGGV